MERGKLTTFLLEARSLISLNYRTYRNKLPQLTSYINQTHKTSFHYQITIGDYRSQLLLFPSMSPTMKGHTESLSIIGFMQTFPIIKSMFPRKCASTEEWSLRPSERIKGFEGTWELKKLREIILIVRQLCWVPF